MCGSGTDSWFLLMLAVLPALAVMFFVWKMDKREKEPVKLLLQLLGLGALTTISAIILETVFNAILNGLTSDWRAESILTGKLEFVSESKRFWYQFLNAFFCVAMVEESGKFLVLYLRTWKCPEFDFSYDAVVYAVASSLGFATVENILYVFRSENGLSTAVMRAITSVPGHAIFAVFMGCFFGKAKYSHYIQDRKATRRNMLLSLTVPTLLHGFYDFCLFMEDDDYLIAFFGFEILITILAIYMIIRLSHNDKPVSDPRPVWNPFAPAYRMSGYPMQGGYPQPYRPPVYPGYPMQGGYPQPYRPPVYPGYPMQTGYPQPYRQPVNPGYPMQTGYPQPYRPPVNPGYPAQTGYPQPYRPPVNPGYPAQTGYPQPYRPPVNPAGTAPNAYQTHYPNGYARPGVTQNASMPELNPKPQAPAAPTAPSASAPENPAPDTLHPDS